MPPKTGWAMVDIKKTNTSIHTMMEAFPVILTTLSVLAMPTMEPTRDHAEIHNAYQKFKYPFKAFIQHALIVETITRYIPVALDTLG